MQEKQEQATGTAMDLSVKETVTMVKGRIMVIGRINLAHYRHHLSIRGGKSCQSQLLLNAPLE